MHAYILDGVRTPIGRYGGALSSIRTDDLAALPIAALMKRQANIGWHSVDDIIYGCANQAGEDNRNVARMAGLLAGVPVEVGGTTVNRLCGSGLDAVGLAARSIKAGDADLIIAGGVESMSRAPFVMPKIDKAFSRNNAVYDTTIGWRFVNPKMQELYGTDSMPETADNVAADFGISRKDQDAFALRSQQRWKQAQENDVFAKEICPVSIPMRNGDPVVVEQDEHPRPEVDMDSLTNLRGVNGPNLTVTAGNASGVNDGAAALLIGSDTMLDTVDCAPKAKILGMAAAGVEPRIMGIGPISASRKIFARTGLSIEDMDVIELNEAFAAQALAVLRGLGVADDAEHVNPNGGAIAMGHPLGMSGARLVISAMNELHRRDGHYALCTMCVGVGQGLAMIIEKL